MKILIVGSGGREHTIAWKLAQNPEVTDLYVAPGNAGTAALGTNVRIDPSDLEGLKNFVKENSVDLTMVGPEQPLVDGIVDAFQNENLSIFGPRQNAAQLEGSKAFAKDFMHRHNIPTAGYQTFSDYEKALTYLHTLSPPLVVKASGLAAGKGVIICHTQEEAEQTAHEIMVDRKFGAAGAEVVIEEFLDGEELSIIAITDGNAYKLLVPSQDHKPVYDGDEGPNTGGMGAYAPAPAATPNLIREVEEKIIVPTLQGM
ncbi:MAG TPA: phosphoribosylamine--glycine ligase, partial [bacterium]|nr:phosphoribosylamine--glycine ligase [bacterium]